MSRTQKPSNPHIHFTADPPELKAQAIARFQPGETLQSVLNALLRAYVAGKVKTNPRRNPTKSPNRARPKAR